MGNVQNNNEISDTILKINTAFGGDDRYCTEVLKNEMLTMTQPDGSVVNSVDFWNIQTVPPTVLTNVLTRGQKVDSKTSLIIKDIRIKPVAETGTIYGAGNVVAGKTILANLEFTFSKSESLGSQESIRRIPIYAATDVSDRIILCSSSASSSILVLSQICLFTSYGFASYDPFTKTCNDSPDVVWVDGGPASASCPSGMRVATSRYSNPTFARHAVCRVNNGGLITPPPRTYTNNLVDSGPFSVGENSLNIPTSTCNFVYINGTDTSSFTTSIKCVPN